MEPWDWFYYAEKVRQAEYQLDESALRPYFKLENVRDGAFWVAQKLYGITFTELKDMPVHHPEAKVFEAKDADGTHLAVFYVDYHPRVGKRSGAWATRLRGTWVEEGKSVRPVVANVCNFSRPAGDQPALLTRDEVETLFHEFGHGLHSILSRVSYRSLGGTPTDFVELPSQIMENWAFEPEVMAQYARHWQTGEAMPAALVEKIHKAEKFNQGFKTSLTRTMKPAKDEALPSEIAFMKKSSQRDSRGSIGRKTKGRVSSHLPRCDCGSTTGPCSWSPEEWAALRGQLALSAQESKVVKGILSGQKLTAIAAELDLGLGTVKTYSQRVYRKLHVSNHCELALAVLGALQQA